MRLRSQFADSTLRSMQKQSVQNRMRELRKQHGLKLYDVAALVRRDTATVHRWETGETSTVPDDAKRALAERYGVSVDHLMGWDSIPEPTGSAA